MRAQSTSVRTQPLIPRLYNIPRRSVCEAEFSRLSIIYILWCDALSQIPAFVITIAQLDRKQKNKKTNPITRLTWSGGDCWRVGGWLLCQRAAECLSVYVRVCECAWRREEIAGSQLMGKPNLPQSVSQRRYMGGGCGAQFTIASLSLPHQIN